MAITEKVTNLSRTTLSASISSTGATSMTVTSATGFPTSGNFRIRVDNEFMLVTAGQGTTTWTMTRGVEGSTAATHSSGAGVYQVVTAGFLDHIIQNHTHTGGTEGVTVTPFGWQPNVYPDGFYAAGAYTTTGMALAAPGGTLMVPVTVGSQFALHAIVAEMTDTSLTRTWSWSLWQEPTARSNALTFVARSAGVDSWTASGNTARTLAALNAPVLINAGCYWLAIHNNDTANDLCVGYLASVTFTNTKAQTKSLSNFGKLSTSSSPDHAATTPNGLYSMVGKHLINNTTSVVSYISGAVTSGGICATNDYFYSVQAGLSTVYRIATSTGSVTSVSVSSGITSANGICVSPDGAYVYVAGTNGTVAIVRTSDFTYLSSFNITTPSSGIAGGCVMDPAGVYAYFGNGGGSNFCVRKVRLSDNTVVASTTSTYIPYGTTSFSMAIKPDGSVIYFGNNSSTGYIYSITTSTMTGSNINTGIAQPVIHVATDSTNLYFTQPNNNSWSTTSLSSWSLSTYTIPTASSNPYGITPISNGDIYIACAAASHYIGVFNGKNGGHIIRNLDATAATWTAQSYIAGVYLSGRPFGGSSGW